MEVVFNTKQKTFPKLEVGQSKVKDASRKLCYNQCFTYYVLEKEVHEEE